MISVIIPVYDVEQYLDRCIISVVHQSYRSLEIILVDDGSPDNCPSICDSWAERDSRIRVVHKENGGLSDARNAGLRYATGKWVLFVDSDDWIALNMAEEMLCAMQEHDADMAICQYISVDPNGNAKKNFCCEEDVKVLDRREMFELLLADKEVTNHIWRRLYKRDLIPPEVFPKGKNYEDIAAIPILSEKCEKFVLLNRAYYFYMVNPKGIMLTATAQNLWDNLEAKERACTYIGGLYPDLGESLRYARAGTMINIWKTVLPVEGGRGDEFKGLKDRIRRQLREIKPSPLPMLEFRDALLGLAVRSGIPFLDRAIHFSLFSETSPVKRRLIKLWNYARGRKEKVWKKLEGQESRFIVLATPTYGNLGDRALEMGEQVFVNKYFSDYRYCGIPLEHVTGILLRKRKYVRKRDLVAIQAGGNMGTLYPGIHRRQERAIRRLKKRQISVFPQTYYYSADEQGRRFLNRSNRLYASCDNLKIFVRDESSFHFVKENIPCGDVEWMPDMALMLPEFDAKGIERKGAMVCFRNDKERTMSVGNLDRILGYIEERFGHVVQEDTHVYHDDLPQEEAEKELEKLFIRMASVEIVLTDRLHGMVFAALTRTPCIVVSSKSYKIQGVYDWIRENEYIQLLGHMEELPRLTEKAVSADRSRFERSRAEKQFERMAAMIRGQMGESY